MRIELKQVRKRFGRAEALRGVSASVEPGGRVALIGPNGSGKSTLMRALLGLIECEGEVLLDDRSPYSDRVALARRFAYVPQVAPQLSASAEELVRLTCITRDLDREAIVALTRRLELDLPAIGARPFRHLSGGMKHKLLLSLALAPKPELLVLDEPTASLDPRTRERFFALASELPQSSTLLLCSHRLEELRSLGQRVIALEDGKVVYDGPAHPEDAQAASIVDRILAGRDAEDARG